MKKFYPLYNGEELSNYPITNIVKGWFFRIDEISQGYYRVEGIDRWGHSVSRDGINPDQLVNQCKTDIVEIYLDSQ